jgi:sulfate adenylyltransferase (ADP) / ATP adenylyltransferase
MNSTSIDQSNLNELLFKQSAFAYKIGALKTLESGYEIHQDQGVHFVVRILDNIQRKIDSDKARLAANKDEQFNPFLPYEENLYIGHASPTHVCLLNKFNIVEHHFLIVTADYQSQDDLLNTTDFDALYLCLKQVDGLGFYNGGKLAGASQHHKHLQITPLPLAPGWSGGQEFKLPIETALYNPQKNQSIFQHAIKFFNKGEFFRQSGQQLFAIYQNLMSEVNRWPEDKSAPPTGPYNLLCTQDWMMVVPRTKECINGVSVNSIGFAGGFLVKNKEDLKQLIDTGLMRTLIEAS